MAISKKIEVETESNHDRVCRCENCGNPVNPYECKDGYTPCCNELIVYPRNPNARDY